jgi:phage protein U
MDWAIDEVEDTAKIFEGEQTIIFPMNAELARRLTNEIRIHLGHLSDARDKILQVYRAEGWKALGYGSFSDYGKAEFGKSFQQVYNLRAAAEFDEELNLYSSEGEIYEIPVNHAKELRKLKTPEKRVRAYQKAEQMAKAQGKDAPTQKIVEDAIHVMEAEEVVEESPYAVVRQMLAEASLTAPQAKQITLELNRLNDEPAQAYIQSLMARYRLNNPDLVYPLGYKYLDDRKKGKSSKVLDEIDRTNGYLAGTPLSRAILNDLSRANAEAQAEYISGGVEQKRLELLSEGKPLPIQFALTLWKNAPVKSVKELIRLLPPKDLEAMLILLAQHFGYEATEALSEIVPSQSLPDAKFLQLDDADGFEDEQEYQVLFRKKPKKEEKKEAEETNS